MDGRKRKLPIGIDDFGKLIREEFYYVDKTGMIEELLHNWGEVNLFVRPRRFGKSLNMSMLQYFFEVGTDRHLFDGLIISEDAELCEEWMGQYPVISLILKDVWGIDYQDAMKQMAATISYEVGRHDYLQESAKLDEADRKMLYDLRMKQGSLEDSLLLLSNVLYKYWGRQVVVLMDEYDVPLQKAEERGYYEDLVAFISRFLRRGMKTNPNIKLSVVTGCLRVAKESIFTGFNNPKMHSIVDTQYDEWFGFTDAEVHRMLDYYEAGEYYEVTKEWYDGYLFGNTQVYCPWDVINWCNQLAVSADRIPQNFWANVSGNDIMRRFADKADKATRDQIVLLIEGGSVKKMLRLDLTYKELNDSIENLWSILFTTGYLTQRCRDTDGYYELVIPNREVKNLFMTQVDEWFKDKVLEDTDGLKEFFEAVQSEDAAAMEECLIDYMESSVSYLDGGKVEEKENFYHGLLLGMLANWKGWNVVSNREAGKGRLDIVAYRRKEKYALIIEVKYSGKASDLDADAQEALNQIRKNKYDKVFGRHVPDRIVHYGISFCKTDCRVLKE